MNTDKGVSIRFARKDDIKECMKFDHSKREDIVANKITMGEIIVAEVDSKIVGYLKLEYIWSAIPYISLILIDSKYRHRGIGTTILKFLEAFLLAKGYKTLLSSSQVNEEGPQAWHRSKGFDECGILSGINEGGIGEVFFRKRIGV
jgi:N-acetylglutamate synthase-like GNAT family acetyltransferase